MRILGIETSCDETAAAIVENGTRILSNVVASSTEMHTKYGGIIPEIAAREQVRCIIPVLEEAMQSAECKVQNIDTLAVTVGPGLIGSLLVGIETAKTLAYVWNKPIVLINHLVAHIYANWLNTDNRQQRTENIGVPGFPSVALVVSGGHTDLVLMKDHGKIEWIGGTRDDAAGECFDKCARLLGLGYPGGPAIAAEAAKYNIQHTTYNIKLPRPMINEENFDFSFSGLKTAVLREVNNLKTQLRPAGFAGQAIQQLSFEIQEAITDVLVAKTVRAAEKYKVKSILLAGGVSANQRLREKFQISNFKFQIHVPPARLCTDNAAYIASCAFFNNNPVTWQEVTPTPGLTIIGEI